MPLKGAELLAVGHRFPGAAGCALTSRSSTTARSGSTGWPPSNGNAQPSDRRRLCECRVRLYAASASLLLEECLKNFVLAGVASVSIILPGDSPAAHRLLEAARDMNENVAVSVNSRGPADAAVFLDRTYASETAPDAAAVYHCYTAGLLAMVWASGGESLRSEMQRARPLFGAQAESTARRNAHLCTASFPFWFGLVTGSSWQGVVDFHRFDSSLGMADRLSRCAESTEEVQPVVSIIAGFLTQAAVRAVTGTERLPDWSRSSFFYDGTAEGRGACTVLSRDLFGTGAGASGE